MSCPASEFSMQYPTCTDIRIRSIADAHKIFTAIHQGILHMVARRLDADERQALRPGCIYVWEERGPHTETTGIGIERFTEGRRWSPSRVRDEFLFYYEKYIPPPDINNPRGKPLVAKPPRDWDPLVKQTYSVWVDVAKGRRKWHLTAYFSQATIDQPKTVDDFSNIRNIVVSDKMFKSTRLGKNRTRAEGSRSRKSDSPKAATSPSQCVPTPYPDPKKGSLNMAPIYMHEPYQVDLSAESPTSPHGASPSPVSPYHEEYPMNHGTYSDQGGSQSFSSSYPILALPNTDSSFHSPKTSDAQASPSYHPSHASSSSWSNESGLDYGDSQRMAELAGTRSSSLSSALPSAFTLANQVDNTYTYSYPSHTPTPAPSSLYSTSYSMSSALGPLPSPPVPEPRGGYLSPLLIPDRIQGPSSHSHEHQICLAEAFSDSPENFDYLAPLNMIKRSSRYRRDPADENTLRRLQSIGKAASVYHLPQ